jgi:hypothetical protein
MVPLEEKYFKKNKKKEKYFQILVTPYSIYISQAAQVDRACKWLPYGL